MGEIDASDQHRLLTIVRDGLEAGGYEGRLIRERWGFADVFEPDDPRRSVPLAAFGQDPPSYRTACWGVVLGADEEVRHLRALGAPQVLQLGVESVIRWKINATGDPESLDTFAPNRLIDVFRDQRKHWGPRSVLRLKGIAVDPGPRQLDFYDVGLIPAIDEVVFEKLDRVLRDAISRARHVYSEHSTEELDESQLVRLVFQLLAAKVFGDRSHPGVHFGEDAERALAAASSLYGQDDALAPVLGQRETQAIVWQTLRSAFNLQNISVEALAHVYENTLVTRDHRRATGTHATPPSLAEYIVRRLPFDSVPEDQRRIFEPFAGHAAFLIAAMGRLRELLHPAMTAEQRHAYFVQSLTGMENDPFALEVAKLSLLLADYPNPNSWNVQQGDVFSDSRTQGLIENATVILCNPPFEWFDKAQRARYDHLKISNPAVEILDRVLASPPSLLGFVLPWSFVDGQSYRHLRRRLIETYGRLEVVGLPDTVFKQSQVEPVLLLASERGESRTVFRCAEVTKNDYERFTRTWSPSWRTESVIDRDKDVPHLWRHPLDEVWETLDHLPKLGTVALIHRGIEYKDSAKEHVSTTPRSGFRPGLLNLSKGYEQFFIKEHVYLDLSPESIQYRSHLNPWDEPKVIVNAARTSRDPWRIAAVPDRSGLVCYERFHGVWPQTGLPIELLAAVLNGYVANAYVSVAKGSRDVKKSRLNGIPVPNFSSSAADRIVALVAHYQVSRVDLGSDDQDLDAVERCAVLLSEIDAEVLGAYALEPFLERKVIDWFRGRRRRLRRRIPQVVQDRLHSGRLPRISLPLTSISTTSDEGEDLLNRTVLVDQELLDTLRAVEEGLRLEREEVSQIIRIPQGRLRPNVGISPSARLQLIELNRLAEKVAENFADDTIRDWLETPSNALWGETPITLLHQGRLAEIFEAIESLEHGAFV